MATWLPFWQVASTLLPYPRQNRNKGSDVYIKGINDDVRAVFAMTGFINIFKFK